jgi:NitT/TauT family transport system ATP-binding protein
MTMRASHLVELPSYLDHPPEVAARLEELGRRPVVLEIDAVSREFESAAGTVRALDAIFCQVRRREFVSVIGPSGCGKSTLIRILAGLDWPTDGDVRLDGVPVTGPGSDRGMVFQGYTLFPWLTVKKNVMFGLRMKGISRRRADEQARHWLEVVGLEAFEDHYPSQLSGGMKQRVAIARALANEPRILLMDEPFGALDAQTRCSMQTHLLRVWESVDVTIVFITHDLDEATLLSDRIVVLGANPGRVLEVIDVPLPRPRSSELFLSGHFLATRKRLEELIHGGETISKRAAPTMSSFAA